MKRRADWIAWTLQFLFGLALGASLGFAPIARSRRAGLLDYWLAEDQVATFVWGVALLGAGLASLYGDRLWLGSIYRVAQPDGVRHSGVSRGLSLAAGAIGGILVLMVLTRHFSAA